MIVAYVPGVDLARSGAPPITDIGASLDADSPIVLVDADTGEHWPFFAELDAHADPPDQRALDHPPGAQPARGSPLRRRPAQPARRRRCADRGRAAASSSTATASRRSCPRSRSAARTGARVRDARRAGVGRDDLFLAWDFTVASERNLAGRLLHIRDDAFASLDGGGPSFTVTQVEDDVDDRISAASSARSRAELPDRRRQPRQPVRLRPGHRAGRAPGPQRRLHRQLHLQHPALGERGRQRPGAPGARRRVRPRAARQQRRGRTRATSARWRTSTTSCSARRSGPACPRTTSASRS